MIDQDHDLLENETSPVTFTCRATGEPVPTIGWYFNAINVSDGSDNNIITTTVRGGVIESSLTIISPRASDSGTYACHAENVIGNDISAGILTINGKNKVINDISIDRIIIIGRLRRLCLICIVESTKFLNASTKISMYVYTFGLPTVESSFGASYYCICQILIDDQCEYTEVIDLYDCI